VLQIPWKYWLQSISRLSVVKVFSIFTEKETVKEGLKDNLDVTLQRFTEDSVENVGDAVG